MPQLLKDMSVYGLGEVAVKAFSFLTLPIYTRLFSPGDYGVMSYVHAMLALLMAILILGGDTAYARFFFEAKTLAAKRLITSTWLAFLATWAVFAVLALLPLRERLAMLLLGDQRQSLLLAVALLSAPLSLTNRMCAQVLRNEFRSVLFTGLNIASTALAVVSGLVFVLAAHLGVLGVFVGILFAEAVMLPVRLHSARRMLRPRFSLRLLRKLLAYGLPLVPTSLAYWIFTASDRVVLGKLSSPEQLGLYGVAASLVSLMTLANSAIGQAWMPHAVRVREDDPEQASVLYGRFLSYLLVASGALCVTLTLFAPEILRLFTSPPFFPAAAAVAPLALGLVAQATILVTAGGITMSKRTIYFAIYSWCAALANLVLNVWLVPRFGMLGAAVATMLSYVLLTVFYLRRSQRLWHVAYEVRRSLTAAALIVGFTMVAVALSWVALPVKMGVFLLYVAALLLCGVIDRQEDVLVWALLRHRAD